MASDQIYGKFRALNPLMGKGILLKFKNSRGLNLIKVIYLI